MTALDLPSGRRIAVVGAGPAGLYAAQAGLALPGVTGLDVFDQLPAPYGLVRYGVAADHAKTKTVVRVFQKLFDREDVRFFGNVGMGADLRRPDLLAHYDAVVYATGARDDRSLGIPGEHLPGSHGAAELVSWYSGHPDAGAPPVIAAGTAAAVIGAGNVALDVVRILAKDAELLAGTDMPDAVLDVLRASTLTDIHLIARRGPAQARFTAVELRELGELADADIVIDPADLDLDEASQRDVAAAPGVQRNLRLMAEWAGRPRAGRRRRIHLHFWTAPLELLGEQQVRGLVARRQRPGADAEALALDDVRLVVRAIGYRARPLPGVPFDPARHVVPNERGRVLGVEGVPRPGEYVAGWLKRGPSGVIGTNRKDAAETVARLAEDLDGLPRRAVSDPDAMVALLRERAVRFVDWAAWKRLEEHERSLGLPRSALTVKVADRATMLRICHDLVERS